MHNPYLIGVDVGSSSARAGVFDQCGSMLGHASQAIETHREGNLVVEQSAEDIWQAVCRSVRGALAAAAVDPAGVVGIGFDATCSLVLVGEQGRPLAASPGGPANRNIIVWMDHRATAEAAAINATRHAVLDHVGGCISPEMQMPKLAWLRRHNPASFDAAEHFFDLTDYLTWRASGDTARSACTVTCKWNYLAHTGCWPEDYFHAIGLGSLADQRFARIGTHIVDPGTPCGRGLTVTAAHAMGLPPGIAVAAGLIDAHAGGLGTLGVGQDPEHTLAYVFGTSSCTMTSTRGPVFVRGVWGPYYSAMLPDLWLSEGGQSAAGAAVDRLIDMHPSAAVARQAAQDAGMLLPVYLAERALAQVTDPSAVIEQVHGLHVVPEFIGNRAPFADPAARAVICGLGMENDLDSLVALYIAGICSLGYGLRQIIEAQAAQGVDTRAVVISGGAGAHPLVRQLLADTCRLPVLATRCAEPVLLGSAMLGAVASGVWSDTRQAMTNMTTADGQFLPSRSFAAQHERRYAAFRQLQDCARDIRRAES